MFKVVEFFNDDGNGGELSVVRKEWLTPRKKHCMWPPHKSSTKFNKCLIAAKSVPDEIWSIYPIKRLFYETDDLIKARQKCKKAETDSELATDLETEIKNRKRKKKVLIYESDESSVKENENYVEINYPKPPTNKPLYNNGTSPKPQSEASIINEIMDSTLQSSNIPYMEIDSPSLSNIEELGLITPTAKSTQNITLDKVNGALDVISKHLGGIKSELKELKKVQDDILLRVSPSCSVQASLPGDIYLPIKETEDLYKTETCLENEENRVMLEKYLGYIGGNKTSTIVRRILERIFDNNFAIQCNWTGKNKKRKLKGLRLIEVILNAVRRNRVAEKATDKEITDVLTSWFRFAKDRNGGREQRRESTQP